MNPPKATGKAYSYIRFSTPEQAQGDSLRRQTSMAADYCARHGLTLDTELNMRDLGVSAYRGKNLDGEGKLGAFLYAVKEGDVPQGAVLLLESLDRLTRQSARKAVAILGDIVDLGIDVVTLNDGKRYSKASFDDIELVIAVLLMSRAHNESKEKGRRVAAAWDTKTQDARNTGKLRTRIVPGWIRVTEKGKRELIPDRAAIVRRIFKMFASGTGKAKIAWTLNQEKVPPFGLARFRKRDAKLETHLKRRHQGWSRVYIDSMLRSTTVLGTMTPHTSAGTRVPKPPIEGYYPAVFTDRELFDKAQVLLETTHKQRPSSLAIQNILAGLAKCPHCDGTMTRKGGGRGVKDGTPKLVCAWAKTGGVCQYKTVPLPALEAALRRTVADPFPVADADLGERLKNTDAQLTALTGIVNGLVLKVEESNSPALMARLKAREAERDAAAAEFAELEKQAAGADSKLFKRRVERYRAAMSAKPFNAGAANIALRELLTKVVVDYDREELVLFWRHNGESRIAYTL